MAAAFDAKSYPGRKQISLALRVTQQPVAEVLTG
jgi:hypothetical protein